MPAVSSAFSSAGSFEVSKNESYRKIKILKQNVAKRVEETLSESMR